MARIRSRPDSASPADARLQQPDDDWHAEHDEVAGRRARRLLSRSHSRFYMLTARLGSMRRWFTGERWVRRLAIVFVSLLVICTACFGGLWWRLGAGPI